MSAEELISQGKASLEAKKVDKAVESFQAACELLAKEHGDLDEKLAHPNYLYGCALLDLAKMESDIIGMSLKGVLPNEGEEEPVDDSAIIDKSENPLSKTELEDIADQVIDAMCEDREAKKDDKEAMETEKAPESESKEAEKEAETEDKEDVEGEEEEDDEEGEEGDDPEASGEKEEEEEEDVSNLQLAWEVFEVSKNIYTKLETKEAKLMVTNCLMKLAEVSREKDEFDQSIADFKAALESRKALCEEHDRMIAEIHFELAITFFTKEDLENAEASFKECITVLNKHVEHLKAKVEAASVDEEKNKLQEEIDQVTEIIKDVQQRSEDAAEELKNGKKPVVTQEKPGFVSNTDAPASDINHLVKKKRTVDDEAKENDETALKKQKVENGEEAANGDCKKVDATVEPTNGVPVNGH